MILIIHVAAGLVALVAGGVALFTPGGRRIHRGSGQIFVASMVVMGLSGALIAARTGVAVSVLAGCLAAYFAITGLTTVRRPPVGARLLDVALCLLAFGLAASGLGAGFRGGAAESGARAPDFLFSVFGVGALLSGIGDARRIRAGGVAGPKRLVRHVWRMCVALFIASGSFFLGQADVIPQPLRLPLLLAIPAFLPLVVMVFWLRRVLGRGRARRLAAAPPGSAF